MEANDSLLRQCVKLNNSPVTQFTRTANLVTNDDIDPDDNFYNGLNVDSAYYTEDEFNDKIVSKLQAASTFSIIHFNARSMSANFNKLKSVLSSIDFTFDVIAVTETWLSDDDIDSFHMDDYDDIYILVDLIVAGVELHYTSTDYYSQNLYHSSLNVFLTVLKLSVLKL